MWVGRVWDRNIGGLFLFMFAVAHTPRVVNEAFDLRTVSQLQLDQLTENLKLGPREWSGYSKSVRQGDALLCPSSRQKNRRLDL